MKVKLLKQLFWIVFSICFPVLLFAQIKPIDSLKSLLLKYAAVENFEKDTSYINTLNELAFLYHTVNPDTTIFLGREIIELCNKINFQNGKVEAMKSTGLAYRVKGEYNRALDIFNEALDLALRSDYFIGAGKIYHNKAIAYGNQGNYPEALENYYLALKMKEKTGDKIGIATSISGIGAIYFFQGKYNDALTNYIKGLKLSLEINHLASIESSYANIGEVYFKQGKYDDAMENLTKSLLLTKQTGNKETKAFISVIIAKIHYKQGRYNQAIDSYQNSMQLALDIGSKEHVSRSSLGLGDVYLALKDIDRAMKFSQEGINIAKEIGYTELLRDGNEILSRIYEATGSGMQALYHYRLFKLYADSINNQQTEQSVAGLAADYEYNKKEIVLKAAQEKKELEFQKQTNQQRWVIFSAFAALASLSVILWIINRNKKRLGHTNLDLQLKNELIEAQKIKAEETLSQLKATQSQLIQSEKMASLGELTAGIAHEIQNPLNFVNNFSELNKELLQEMNSEIDNGNLEDVKAIAKDIISNEEKINHHGKRADSIVKGMLQHSRSSSGDKEPTDINALADEYLRLAYHGLRAKDKSFNATMTSDYDKSIDRVNVIPQDIGRAILNLITNAFYAVDEKKKQSEGDLLPEGQRYEPIVVLSTKKINARTGDPAGRDKVEIRVKDNGNGIPKMAIDKIFQPFFTTKPTGKGTGLGLSMSYDIITKGHNGELKVNSMEGEGSEFIIILHI